MAEPVVFQFGPLHGKVRILRDPVQVYRVVHFPPLDTFSPESTITPQSFPTSEYVRTMGVWRHCVVYVHESLKR